MSYDTYKYMQGDYSQFNLFYVLYMILAMGAQLETQVSSKS